MSQFRTNLTQWWRGWRHFDRIRFKPGWAGNQLRWVLLYGLNYGTRVLTGGACVSWSRWFYLHRERYRLAKFATRFLNKFDDDHGRSAGDALWGTRDTAWAENGAIVFWCCVLGQVLAGAAAVVRWFLHVL